MSAISEGPSSLAMATRNDLSMADASASAGSYRRADLAKMLGDAMAHLEAGVALTSGSGTRQGGRGVTDEQARRRFAEARVAVLGTVDASGAPHLVPITFAVEGDTVWSAVDEKPKRSPSLRRHANLRSHPAAGLLVQHWDEDWAVLWWVRADGTAILHDAVETVERVRELLQEKYDQYARARISAPVIEFEVSSWHGWASAPSN